MGTIKRRNSLDRVIAAYSTAVAGARAARGARGAAPRGVPAPLPRPRAGARRGVRRGRAGQGPRAAHGIVRERACCARSPPTGAPSSHACRPARRPRRSRCATPHPEWLVALWVDELGREAAEALMAADNRPAERCVRVNRLRATPAQAQAALAADGIAARAAASASADGAPRHARRAARRGSAARDERGLSRRSRHAPVAGLAARRRHGRGAVRRRGRRRRPRRRPLRRARRQDVAARRPARRLARGGRRRRAGESRGACAPTWPGSARPTVEVVERDVLAMGDDAAQCGALRRRPARRALQRSGHAGLAAGPALAAASRRRGAPGRPAAPPARRRRGLVAPGGALTYSVCTLTRAETLEVVERFLAAGPQRWRARAEPGGLGARRSGRRVSRLPASRQRRASCRRCRRATTRRASSSRACDEWHSMDRAGACGGPAASGPRRPRASRGDAGVRPHE